ncbi:MAG: beta-carotene hydroxylase [Bacteroidia bacterium]|nr:beta-carotene hydroxylase [Bacteroidia bacterium]
MLINIAIVIVAFMGMEFMAWFTHKYVMHGLGWFLHKDHHKKETDGFFERNDFFFLIFAIPGMLLMLLGTLGEFSSPFFIGLGITLYGFTYFMVHDIFIHQRFKIFRHTDNFYFKAIRRAHKMHHKHIGKEDGECFGMLWVPLKYFKKDSRSMLDD